MFHIPQCDGRRHEISSPTKCMYASGFFITVIRSLFKVSLHMYMSVLTWVSYLSAMARGATKFPRRPSVFIIHLGIKTKTTAKAHGWTPSGGVHNAVKAPGWRTSGGVENAM